MERTTKRKKSKPNNGTHETEPVTPTPKRKRTGDAYIEEQTDQEHEETSTKKKKRKTESHQEADDVTADVSSTVHQKHNGKIKKSLKAKDSKRLHGEEGLTTEEATYSEFTDPEGRSKKKKLKKDFKEHLLEDSLVEETLTREAKHATGKKKNRKGGRGLQEDYDENNLQHGFTEEPFFERKYPDCSGSPKQLVESVKKKTIKKGESREADDIAVEEEKIKNFYKAKDVNELNIGEGLSEEALYRETADIEHKPTVKNKKKKHKDCREHILEDNLLEESLTPDAQHISKKKTKKQKDGGGEGHRLDCFTVELLTKRRHQGVLETIEQVDERVMKKKKKRKDESKEAADKNIEEFSEEKDFKGIHRDEEVLYGEPADIEHGLNLKQKVKKDGRERILEDRLGEELLTAETQHISKKKNKKQKDGGDKSHSPYCVTGELLTKRKHQSGPESVDQVDENEDQVEDILVQRLLIPEAQHAYKKNKRWKDGGGSLQAKDDESNLQHSFNKEHTSQRNYPGSSETPEQVDERVMKKKKKKRKDESKEVADKNTEFSEEKDFKGIYRDKEVLYGEPADIEHRLNLKKKVKKDGRERILEDRLGEELLTAETQHIIKKKNKKQKDGGDKSHSPDCVTGELLTKRKHHVTGELLTKRKHQIGLESVDQVDESEDHIEDILVEHLLIPDIQHGYKKKKKRKDGGKGLQEKNVEINLQHGFTEECISERKYPHSSEGPEQVVKSVKKKKKKRKTESKEVDDLTADDENITEFCEERAVRGLHIDEETLYGGPADVEHRPSLKKKAQKDRRERNLDSLEEELLTAETQHISKERKKKRKDGGDERHSPNCFTGEHATIRKHQGGLKTTEQVDGSVDRAEDSLMEASLVLETQHAYKKKKKRKGGGDLQEDGLTLEHFTQRNCPDNSETTEKVDTSVDQEEKPVKKGRRRDEPPQEAGDMTADDASSSVWQPGEESSNGKLNDTEARPSYKKKKKSRKNHGERPLENNLVEESSTPNGQHTSKKKTKRKSGGDENRKQHCFPEELVKYQGDSANTEQVDETVDQAEEHVKKKKTHRREETHLEDDDAPADSTQINQLLQSQIVVSNGDLEVDAEKPSTSRSGPQASSPTDADQNLPTQDQHETSQNGGDKRSTASDQKTEKPIVKRGCFHHLREADKALIKEYFPNITDKRLRLITYHELDRIKKAKENGIMFRSGQFTLDEDEIIKNNVYKFVSQVGIAPDILFHSYKFPQKQTTVKEIKRRFHFKQRIAEGLHRRITDVYVRGFQLFQLNIKRGRFSQEEVKQLRKYREIYGMKWTVIAPLMNRCVLSSQLKYSQLRQEVNLGTWSIEEINRLIAAVKQFVLNSFEKGKKNGDEPVTIPKEKLYKGISWVKIGKAVETRNWTHCKRKWFELILKRMNDYIDPLSGTLGRLNSIKMIKWLHDNKMKEYGDVKWEELSNFIGNVPPFLTSNKFALLKHQIPGWKELRLHEIVSYLYTVTIPKLEAKVLAQEEMPLEPETKNEFLFSEMFQEYTEYEDGWNLPKYIAEVGTGGGLCGVHKI